MTMTRSEEVIERALALVAASRAQRERDLQRRAEWQKRIEISRPVPHVKSGVQLSLRLNS
jgi:hypothetical protein